jgi:hypothetical protein
MATRMYIFPKELSLSSKHTVHYLYMELTLLSPIFRDYCRYPQTFPLRYYESLMDSITYLNNKIDINVDAIMYSDILKVRNYFNSINNLILSVYLKDFKLFKTQFCKLKGMFDKVFQEYESLRSVIQVEKI